LETLARQERYALLARACRDHQIRWLFVGHHADDQQETAIFRLARASGIYGLAGLAPVASWPFPYALEAASIDASLMTPNGPHTIRQTALGLLRPLLTIPKVCDV
jgi:tRNA(Ile)-lysidine synthase TilS/MesJ